MTWITWLFPFIPTSFQRGNCFARLYVSSFPKQFDCHSSFQVPNVAPPPPYKDLCTHYCSVNTFHMSMQNKHFSPSHFAIVCVRSGPQEMVCHVSYDFELLPHLPSTRISAPIHIASTFTDISTKTQRVTSPKSSITLKFYPSSFQFYRE